MNSRELLLWLKDEHDKAEIIIRLELSKHIEQRDLLLVMYQRGKSEAMNQVYNKIVSGAATDTTTGQEERAQ